MAAKKPHVVTRRFRKGSSLIKWLKHHSKRVTFAVVTAKAAVKHPSNKGKRALALAGHFVGLKEYPAGSNMQLFGKWFGMNGVPWCAIFVSYVLSHVGRRFHYSYVPQIVADAHMGVGGLRTIPFHSVAAALKAGKTVLACFDWTHDGTADHVGFVTGVAGSFIHTIEGNTGDTNWSNGGEVLRETRASSLVQAFVEVS